jgi:hypothetical protein
VVVVEVHQNFLQVPSNMCNLWSHVCHPWKNLNKIYLSLWPRISQD